VIVAKCPTRISLVGGSSDLDSFLKKNERGAVISFPCNLNTYISIHENHRNNFIVDYSIHEKVKKIEDIKNDVARVVLDRFCPKKYLTVGFNSDTFSVGSGLAASSSYMISLIKAVTYYQNMSLSDFDICKLALELERQFNPLTGQQDTYGCGMMDFKKIEFSIDRSPKFTYLPSDFLDSFEMYLVYTGNTRSSTKVLKSIDIDKVNDVVGLVDSMEKSIISYDYEAFYDILNEGWKKKKETSGKILSDSRLIEIDSILGSSDEVKAHKLCGAGGGGHFAIFTDKGSSLEFLGDLRKWTTGIRLSQHGLRAIKV